METETIQTTEEEYKTPEELTEEDIALTNEITEAFQTAYQTAYQTVYQDMMENINEALKTSLNQMIESQLKDSFDQYMKAVMKPYENVALTAAMIHQKYVDDICENLTVETKAWLDGREMEVTYNN